ncbi:MAG: hypothetical protein ACR2RB_09620, partial [Gammaproteobacteria bacterium]
HVTLELESIDRMYLNGYVANLQTGAAAAYFIRKQFDCRMASTFQVAPMSRQFVANIEQFVDDESVELVKFHKGERKDDIAKSYLEGFCGDEGVLFVGKAQEKTYVFRTETRRSEAGASYPWLVRSTAMVNHYYFYLLDKDFGPLFIKFCSYFPYAVKLCINGHEWLKCQLRQRKITFEALDNGVVSCDDPKQAQKIANQLDENKIERVFRKWLRRLPHPFEPRHRAAGYRYQLSILQAEFALTQVLDRPLHGRQFFEEVIRENLDLGRPDQVQLIFERRVQRNTPGRFRTRVLTDGVVPTLHVDYKHSKIKQYHKQGRALRTETTINNTYDFRIGRLLKNLGALRQIGFHANRRLLRVQTLSHDCLIGEDRFGHLTQAVQVDKQRASALRFGDRRVLALMHALCQFSLLPEGLRHGNLRPAVAQLLGQRPDEYRQGQMTYDLRRLRLHGLIERIPSTHRYQVTKLGMMAAQFYTRFYARALRPAFSCATDGTTTSSTKTALGKLDRALGQLLQHAQLAA